MYYEERLIGGVMYVRHTPNGKWIEKSKTGYQPKNGKVYSVDLTDVGGSLLFDVVKKLKDGNYMISLIDGKKNYTTYADNMPELFERLADAFRAMEDSEQ